MKLKIIKDDITKIAVDAIVNAANSSLLGGGGVDGAIHSIGGKQILEECIVIRNKQGGCNTGEAVITSAGNLPSNFVIHTVGPVWNGDKEEKKLLLENCYRNVLELAVSNNIKTIAFPNISTGIYHFPKDKAAEIAINTVTNFIQKDKIEEVIFVCFDEENYEIYDSLLKIVLKKKKLVHAALFGLAVGDALGVPVEFKSRESLKMNPVKGMQEFGTHNQPKGTWSDDSSLTFCLAESLCKGYTIESIAKNFLQWYNSQIWTPHGEIFDNGIATSIAMHALNQGVVPTLAGGKDENSNGNGSLMRILPLVFYSKDFSIEQRFQIIKEVSSITHAHIRSVLACFMYIEFALQIIKGNDKWISFKNMQLEVAHFLDNNAICSQDEFDKFHRIMYIHSNLDYKIIPIHEYSEAEINSSGYVLHSLEASIWCILNSNSYEETVLKAVNLGGDTDTTAAIAGGLAGLIYGYDAIPKEWIHVLARKNDIEKLCDKLSEKYEIH